MARFTLGQGLILLVVAMFASAAHSAAAYIELDQNELVDHFESSLPELPANILDVAQTDHMAVIYAQAQSGPHITITIHAPAKDATRLVVSIHTDSPKSPALEARILAALPSAN